MNNVCYVLPADMETKNLVIYTSVTEVLFATMLASLACFIIVYKWKRRKLEKLAEQFPGPPALPIIGNALEFLGSPEGKSEKNRLKKLKILSVTECRNHLKACNFAYFPNNRTFTNFCIKKKYIMFACARVGLNSVS